MHIPTIPPSLCIPTIPYTHHAPHATVYISCSTLVRINYPLIGLHIQTNQPEAVFHSPKVQLVDLCDQLFVVVFLILPLVGGLHFDSRPQIFSPGPPLDYSVARFRSCPARWAGSSREDGIGAEDCATQTSRLPSRWLLVAIRVSDTKSKLHYKFQRTV